MITTPRSSTTSNSRMLYAAIGVWFRDDKTFYVKRSEMMRNYPGAWSLFSIQYNPNEYPDPFDLKGAQNLMEQMAKDRLLGTKLRTLRFLTGAVCTKNPINKIVNMRLYQLDFPDEPRLDSEYYSDSDWMTHKLYSERNKSVLCGSCIKLWKSFDVKNSQELD